jgi:site-specific DNA-methyltransferase (adenine-specific)
MSNIALKHQEGLQFLSDIPENSVDLILTDPPYITSRDSGMDKWVDHVAKQDEAGAKNLRSVKQWRSLKTLREWVDFLKNDRSLYIYDEEGSPVSLITGAPKRKLKKYKADYLKYGSIYGKKYAVKTNYGDWDSQFTMEQLELFTKHFYRILRPGGTCIIFFDLWKITNLKDMLEGEKFKQIRLIEWIKTNPQPINSKVNYLTNCREIALLGVKKSKPTFNSKYDKGIYEYPLQGGKNRFHPTQKSLPLFEALIEKHSKEGDLVLDCFAGSATTAIAAIKTNRNFVGCEMDETYYNKSLERIESEQNNTKNNV